MKGRLLPQVFKGRIEAGCDEAGRGVLGPVVAAAVVLDPRVASQRQQAIDGVSTASASRRD